MLLDASTDATSRGRIISALGHAESPALSERALDLALDDKLRLSEISQILGVQFRNPRTRDRAWRWLKDNFDPLVSRMGRAQAGKTPWFASSMCTDEAAKDVGAFFEPRVSALPGAPRNLAAAVEAIELCAAKAEAHRASVERTFTRL